MNERIAVADPEAGEPTEPVPGLAVRTAFRRGGYRLRLYRIEGGVRSAWHRCDGATFGWVRAGRGRIEWGPREGHAADVGAGEFLRVPAGAARRYVAADGDEPLAVLAVDGAASGAETRTEAASGAESGEGEIVEASPPSRDGGVPEPEVVGADGLVTAVGSPNLTRETPFPDAGTLVMRVRAAGGAAAGWHHHADNVYFGYAVDGPSETEYGPGGESVARIGVGECFHVPPRLVHRDTNPTDEAHTGIIWLCGGEPWVVNVDSPE